MKKLFRNIITVSLTLVLGFFSSNAFAGNKDRSGQAGASELLINPWAYSSGWGNAGMACVKGTDAFYGNIAGIAFTNTIDVNFSYTTWLKGSDVKIVSFGLLARVSESSVLGLSVMSLNMGEIDRTTTESPDGGLGTFKPSMMNINLAFAKSFSNSIHAGIDVKVISESIADMSGLGVAFDAGIQYVTGVTDNIHFGISLKNIGTTIKYTGDGLAFPYYISSMTSSITAVQRADKFELPTQLNIGAAYDFNFTGNYRLTLAGNFNSNSFTKDQFTLGAEGSLKDYLLLRVGYTYEEGIFDDIEDDACNNVNKGLSCGATLQAPLGSKGLKIAVDYSFRATKQFDGTHAIGARILF